MPARLPDNSYELDLGVVLTLARARRRTIHCHAACLWVTQNGSSADIILTPGLSCTIERSGSVAIQALEGRARFSLSTAPGRRKALAARWRRYWQQLCREPWSPWSLASVKIRSGLGVLRARPAKPEMQG